MNRLTLILLVIGIALVMLIINHDRGETFGLVNDDFAHLVYMLPIAGVMGAGVLAGRRGNYNEILRNIAIWLVIITGISAAYLYRGDAERFAGRMVAGFAPGRAVVVSGADGDEVIIHKAMGGHFQADVMVDGRSIPMLVDTGASSVVLSFEDAAAIGIDTAALSYSIPVMTANGRAMAAPVRIDEISIGPITRTDVRAMVSEEGRLDESLLGMSFLSTLRSMNIESDELRLRD